MDISNQSLPIRYPDPAVKVLDKRFRRYVLGSSAVERIWTGGRWAEGPVWFGDMGTLIWSDIPNNRMLQWRAADGETCLFRQPANFANGNTRDGQGRLLTCEHGRRLTRTEHDGSVTVLAEHFAGKRLNAPNDVVVHPDGGIWFTDPGYGIDGHYEGDKAEFELPMRTYRLDPTTLTLQVVEETLLKPNGLAFSPDFKILYIADTGVSHVRGHPRQIHAFDVVENRLSNHRVFADFATSSPDGFRVDIDGNVWAASAWGDPELDGVRVYSPDGDEIGRIQLPEGAANVCFGGVKRNRLFITASQSVYALYVNTQGMPY
ncbi:MAG TPA: gluconolactonase [Gammaproteobacteria bacterium]|nr:gluconolactonase [Gammaproteobacteria bacterium]|tara:strand:+ start:2601 stop:3554 length:954 start_codon:yes stop_codon:yes gene_type:complete